MLSTIICTQRRTNMPDVKAELYFLFRRGRLNLNNKKKEHRNLYNIPEFQTISWNICRNICSLVEYFS